MRGCGRFLTFVAFGVFVVNTSLATTTRAHPKSKIQNRAASKIA
jgi:hypothetical protein